MYLMRDHGTYRPRARPSARAATRCRSLGLALLVIGYIGVFFGKLIKSAVSRQREFLADASAVQFTRNPDGIAGALKKIGGFNAGSRLASPQAEEASHLFFANGLRSSLTGWLATHPPLDERIRRLVPSFSGQWTQPAVEAHAPDKAAAFGFRGSRSSRRCRRKRSGAMPEA